MLDDVLRVHERDNPIESSEGRALRLDEEGLGYWGWIGHARRLDDNSFDMFTGLVRLHQLLEHDR